MRNLKDNSQIFDRINLSAAYHSYLLINQYHLMKKFLLALTVAAATMAPAGAVAWLPAATVTGETVNEETLP